MGQAGLTSYTEAKNDPCFGIMDFSTDEAASKYIELLASFLAAAETELQKGRAVTGIFEYPPTRSESIIADKIIQ